MVFERLDAGLPPLIFGDDYPTPDGTCVRDYVHVADLAEAHVAALDYIEAKEPGHSIFNIGTGTGSSVGDMVDEILAATAAGLTPQVVERRPGDPASVVADTTLVSQELGWTARRTLKDIVTTAWEAHLLAQDRVS